MRNPLSYLCSFIDKESPPWPFWDFFPLRFFSLSLVSWSWNMVYSNTYPKYRCFCVYVLLCFCLVFILLCVPWAFRTGSLVFVMNFGKFSAIIASNVSCALFSLLHMVFQLCVCYWHCTTVLGSLFFVFCSFWISDLGSLYWSILKFTSSFLITDV